MFRSMYIGTSIAISWAWGTSLIIGMQIAQQKGFGAFLTWATANCLTLVFFSILWRKGLIREEVLEKPYVKWLALLIQAFCLIVQLKVIDDVMRSLGASPVLSYGLVTAIGLVFILAMYRKGLDMSILTDNYQGAMTLIALAVGIGTSIYCDVPRYVIPSSENSDLMWGAWSACILMSGIITDIQHWQRAKKNGNGYAFECAAVMFAVYLSLVYTLAHYHLNSVGYICLLIAVLGVTTSTIDSIAVAMHRMHGKTVGTAAACFLCIFWGVFASVGVLTLWSNFGIVRVLLACIIVGLGIHYKRGEENVYRLAQQLRH